MSIAYFCSKTGIRIVRPGVAISAGGDVPEVDGPPDAPLPVLPPEVEVEEELKAKGEPPVPPAEAVTATELPEAKSEPAPEPKARGKK